MAVDSLISLENVAIGYDGKKILDLINLFIGRGEFWGIIGQNGGGKTTLLKTILGLIPPVAGELHTNKKIVFGYVSQREGFDPIFPISVAEVVVMGIYSRLSVGRRVKREDWEVVFECLRKVEVAHLKNHPFKSLSGGEKQRTLLARALAGKPDVLVLDEPTASVDVKGETAILELVRRVKDESGVTVLMVSHLLNAVSRFAENAVFVDKDTGIFLVGKTEEVLSNRNLHKSLGLDAVVDHKTIEIKNSF